MIIQLGIIKTWESDGCADLMSIACCTNVMDKIDATFWHNCIAMLAGLCYSIGISLMTCEMLQIWYN